MDRSGIDATYPRSRIARRYTTQTKLLTRLVEGVGLMLNRIDPEAYRVAGDRLATIIISSGDELVVAAASRMLLTTLRRMASFLRIREVQDAILTGANRSAGRAMTAVTRKRIADAMLAFIEGVGPQRIEAMIKRFQDRVQQPGFGDPAAAGPRRSLRSVAVINLMLEVLAALVTITETIARTKALQQARRDGTIVIRTRSWARAIEADHRSYELEQSDPWQKPPGAAETQPCTTTSA